MTRSLPHHPLLSHWPGAEITFDRAWLSLADGRAGEFADLAPELDPAALRDMPLVLFQTGSAERGQDKALAEWFRGMGLAFLAPRTHLLAGRPSYRSPAPMAVYERVHALRRMELDYTLARLEAAGLFDLTRLGVIGLSEGAVAAATWQPERKCPRVVLAWSMEDSYFGREMTFPQDLTCPILNVIGGSDPFFGAEDSLASIEQVSGHAGRVLRAYPEAKVILYPNCGHRVADDPRCPGDVRRFLADSLGLDAPFDQHQNQQRNA